MKIKNKEEKLIPVEIDITEEEYKLLKSIDWVDVYSCIDSQKAAVVLTELIKLIVTAIEYTGNKRKE